jgi:integrase
MEKQMSITSSRYQQGTVDRIERAKGPDVWIFRWREMKEGKRCQRKRVIGTVDQYKSKGAAQKAVENFRAEVNCELNRAGGMTVKQAWGHFQMHELEDPDVDRSPTTIDGYRDYFKNQILPTWGDVLLGDVKAVAVEKWLRGLTLDDGTKAANGTKAKIRNHLSALFSHCIRHELYAQLNPITSVRQTAVREVDPEILSIDELKAILSRIESPAIKVMVALAATSALRRSELRGLKWDDLDFEGLWFHLRRGLVRKAETKLKTKASRKGVPMNPELAEILLIWRTQTPYPTDADWVFASPFTDGERPYWPESALKDHVRPAALKAGINKTVGWHTFRHSLGSHLGQQGESVKVVQELLRHANSKITLDVYQQADQGAKRLALDRMSKIFVVPPAKSA